MGTKTTRSSLNLSLTSEATIRWPMWIGSNVPPKTPILLRAAFADFTGAIGTGTGILLTVTIIYNFYEQLKNENLDGAHPVIRRFLGEE